LALRFLVKSNRVLVPYVTAQFMSGPYVLRPKYVLNSSRFCLVCVFSVAYVKEPSPSKVKEMFLEMYSNVYFNFCGSTLRMCHIWFVRLSETFIAW
jgi:hypothetical protein